MSTLRCVEAPPDVAQAVDAWFASGGLRLPVEVVWRFRVEDDPDMAPPGAAAVRQGDVAVEPRADGTLRLAHPAGLEAVVAADTPTVAWRLAADATEGLADELHTMGLLALLFALRRAGWHHLHGATAVSPDGVGWLLVGASGSGKSTTIAALGRAGWQIGGDDAAFLAPTPDGRGVQIHPWRGTVALREGGRRLLALPTTPATSRRDKDRRSAQAHGFAAAPSFVPTVVACCALGGETTVVAPLPRSDAAARLVTQAAWVALEPAWAAAHLGLLEQLLRQATTVSLMIAPDLVADPTRILRLPRP